MAKHKPSKFLIKRQQARLERKWRQKPILLTYSAIGILVILAILFGYHVLNQTVLQARNPLRNEILGTWVNSQGYSIQFESGGTGFIPGVSGKIDNATFNYSITDDSHIKINLLGQEQTIEIQITGDQLIWKDSLGEVTYKRVK